MKITMQRDFEIEAVSLRKRLAHQPCLAAHLHVAHLALELGLGRQSGDRIDHQHIDRAGAHQSIGDLERLLAGVRLGDQQLLEIDAELPRIDRVERMLGIDEAANAAALLRLGDDVQSERGLARGFRAVNLDDAAARQPADAERDIEPERAAGDRLDLDRLLVLAEPHDRALAAGPLDLRDRRLESLLFIHLGSFDEAQRDVLHLILPYFIAPAGPQMTTLSVSLLPPAPRSEFTLSEPRAAE